MKNLNSLIRPNILALKPYSSAREEFTGVADVWLDANECPFDNGLNSYPDPYQKELKQAYAAIKQVRPSQLIFGNGSDEIIDLLFRTFCKPNEDCALTFMPTYGMYKVCADIQDVEMIELSLDAEFQINLPRALDIIRKRNPKLIFICSPNNPTGNLIDRTCIEEILATSDGLVIIDEAYADFVTQAGWTARLEGFENLVVLQTFSKARGLAGIRLGVGFANEQIISVLNKIKPPYNINTLTIRKAMEEVRKPLEATINLLNSERQRLVEELSCVPGVVRIVPSVTNFILVEFENPEDVYQKLIDAGIVVRDRSSQVPGCLRITVGTPQENDRLIAKLWGKELVVSKRAASVVRRTNETMISVSVDLDNSSRVSIYTGLGFFDHMLEQIARHAQIGLCVQVLGDLHIDEHHTVEDTALALGEVVTKALGDKKGIERYGFLLPMDDCLAQVAIDFGGRPWLVWDVRFTREKIGEVPTEMFYHFFKSFSDAAKCNLNIKSDGENEHHKIESVFKAFARAIKMAIKSDGTDKLPSTKGVL
jgi:histidinol-phosphate aminotransferase